MPSSLPTTKSSPSSSSFWPSSSSSTPLLSALLCSAFALLICSSSSTVNAEAKFLLSCRVISGICQNDARCLDEMSARFPDCYLESPFDLLPAKGMDVLLAAGSDEEAGPAGNEEPHRPRQAQQPLDKRAPAMKLMKVLMMKDRIPVGRRR